MTVLRMTTDPFGELSLIEAASRLNVGPDVVVTLINLDQLRGSRINGTWRIHADSVSAYMRAHSSSDDQSNGRFILT